MRLRSRLQALERTQAQHQPPTVEEPAARRWLKILEIFWAVRVRGQEGVLSPGFLRATRQFGEAAELLRGCLDSGRLGPQTEYYCHVLLGFLAAERHAERPSPGHEYASLTRHLCQHDLVQELRQRLA